MEKVILFALVVLVVVFIAYQYNPYMFSSLSFLEGFADEKADKAAKEKADKDAKVIQNHRTAALDTTS